MWPSYWMEDVGIHRAAIHASPQPRSLKRMRAARLRHSCDYTLKISSAFDQKTETSLPCSPCPGITLNYGIVFFLPFTLSIRFKSEYIAFNLFLRVRVILFHSKSKRTPAQLSCCCPSQKTYNKLCMSWPASLRHCLIQMLGLWSHVCAARSLDFKHLSCLPGFLFHARIAFIKIVYKQTDVSGLAKWVVGLVITVCSLLCSEIAKCGIQTYVSVFFWSAHNLY